jgi:2-oxoisovalerate dehydrogenase E2 component (dihydrolipoyl transacylase)
MGRHAFRLPDVGEGVAEAEIVAWHVKPGDRVEEDQPLIDVMTDKATVEISSPISGVVLSVQGAPGDIVAVGSVVVEFEVEGAGNVAAAPASPAAPPPPAPSPAPVAAPPPAPSPAPVSAPAPSVRPAEVPRDAAGAPLAAPATRRRAVEMGIPLQFVSGSGPDGRITIADLEAYQAQGGAPARGPAPRTGIHETKIIGMRRMIADRMAEAKRRIPHFTYVEEIDMTALESLRRDLNEEKREGKPKLTLLPFFMRAVVLLQPDFPAVNSRFDDEAGTLRSYDAVHIGIASQTERGLMVPVVRHAEALDLWGCAEGLHKAVNAARDGSASREDLSGSTITLTSLGTLGGISATPIINAPEVAIIGPNKLVERPVIKDGAVVARTMMNLSCSFDHRIIDGHEAARFVQAMKRLLEQPARLFLEMPR